MCVVFCVGFVLCLDVILLCFMNACGPHRLLECSSNIKTGRVNENTADVRELYWPLFLFFVLVFFLSSLFPFFVYFFLRNKSMRYLFFFLKRVFPPDHIPCLLLYVLHKKESK